MWSFDVGVPESVLGGLHVAASDNGEVIVSGAPYGKVHVFDRGGNLLWERKTGKAVAQAEVSADGELVVIAAWDGDWRSGIYEGHTFAYDRSGSLLWEHRSGAREYEEGSRPQVAVSPDGSLVAIGTMGGGLLLYQADGSLRWKHDFGESILGILFWPDGSKLAVGSWQWTIPPKKRKWKKVKPGREIEWARGGLDVIDMDCELVRGYGIKYGQFDERGPFMSLAIPRNGSHLFMGADDLRHNVFLFDSGGGLLWKQDSYPRVVDVAVADNASVIAGGGEDMVLHVLDKRGERLWHHGTGGDPVHAGVDDFALAISNEGSLIVGGAGDEDLYLFDGGGELLFRHKVGGRLSSVLFSDNDTLLVTGSWKGKVMAFDISESIA